MKERKKEAPICPRCNGKDVRSRIRTEDYWCRRCGYIGPREEFIRKEDEVR
uniref:Uncharacterized protein n=1 Tax=viral metagenome TaxID=1070528 RepID=A0A6H2A692_9ZZZZ